MSRRYDPDEGVIIRVATHDDMMEAKASLRRIEERLQFYCNRNIVDIRKKSYQDGWNACNSEAVKFCKWLAEEIIALKMPAEIEDFFGVDSAIDIFKKLEKTGVIRWDKKFHGYRVVD